ncbi:MAG: PadR family transcriptional regulator [Candidatus Dormiibacter spiritus]|nr:MAG: PadR family transcriptional regulator [Candidatus Dormibacteraeota bacterium]
MSISHRKVTRSRLALPNTSNAVLGLLAFGSELSGYEMRRWALNLRFFYWSPAQSQIYAELRRLEGLGYVTSREVEQEGRPDKRLYRITEQGLDAFRHWLNEAPLEPPVLKHSVALRLFFGSHARPNRLIELMAEHVEAMRHILGELSEVRLGLADNPQFRYPALVAEWGQAYFAAEAESAARIVDRLKSEVSESAEREQP